MGPWSFSADKTIYRRSIQAIKDELRAGNTYQVNFTMRLSGPFSGDPYACFRMMCRSQPAEYATFLDTDSLTMASISPELFFSLRGNRILSKPMKGTAARAMSEADDRNVRETLHLSEKNRAENIMIVDMVRNDLGRVAKPGSVRVVRQFDVEPYPTVWQMTSTVEARTTAGLKEIMRAVFPCASVTGAPKANTMRIIKKLEGTPRSVYTGAIGYAMPGRRMVFNVAIRTLEVTKGEGTARYGVGGGIVWDSDPASEYEECRSKARILDTRWPEFDLLETMRWSPSKEYYLLDGHLKRLERSACFFGYRLSRRMVMSALRKAVRGKRGTCRVRLLVGDNGSITTSVDSMPPAKTYFRVCLAPDPIDGRDVFLYHKTTNRAVYEAARKACPDMDDVILHNGKGEITETTIGNLVFEIGGRKVTPPVGCGLLPGVMREHLLASGKIQERVVALKELQRATRIWVINSVRGWVRAELVHQEAALI